MPDTEVQALLDDVAAQLDAGVTLTDTDGRLLEYTAHGDVIDEVRQSGLLHRRTPPELWSWLEHCGIRDAIDPLRVPADAARGILARWCVPVRFRGTSFGYVNILDAGAVAESALAPAVEATGHIGALLYRRHLSSQVEADFLRLLLFPSPENAGVGAEAWTLGAYTHKGPVAVIVAGPRNGELSAPELGDLAVAVRRTADDVTSGTTLAGVISELAVLLAPLRDRDDTTSGRHMAERVCRLASHLNHGLDLVAAVGGATQLSAASRSYAEAQRAYRLARSVPRLGPIVSWDELGILRVFMLVSPEEVEDIVVDPRVRELLADEILTATAETYLDLAGDVQKTASRLFIHRSTLYQRLDRIADLYELDLLTSGDDRLLAHLGIKLAHVTARPRDVDRSPATSRRLSISTPSARTYPRPR